LPRKRFEDICATILQDLVFLAEFFRLPLSVLDEEIRKWKTERELHSERLSGDYSAFSFVSFPIFAFMPLGFRLFILICGPCLVAALPRCGIPW